MKFSKGWKGCSEGIHKGVTVVTVLMLISPLKMLKLSVGQSTGTDRTGPDLTGTMVDLPDPW